MAVKRDDTYRCLKTQKPYDVKLRPDYRVDYARVIHSPAFRRLQNKTQLFPGGESDFFRNRLTHSLEVAQIAKSIAILLKGKYKDTDIEPDVCEIAGLLHDIGHPPFGHNGESALDECMREKSGGFEGNAQTLRIITRLEKKEPPPPSKASNKGKDSRVGLNLTARVIASVLKYDREIPTQRNLTDSVVKGYYQSESDVVNKIKSKLLGLPNRKIPSALKGIAFKTIECSIMDVADDIAYSTYDIEDAFKAGFLNPYAIMSSSERVMENISAKLLKAGINLTAKECRELIIGFFAEVWKSSVADIKAKKRSADVDIVKALLEAYKLSEVVASDGYYRTSLTSNMIQFFIDGLEFVPNKDFPILSRVRFNDDVGKIVEILKHTTYETQIESARLKVAENRGKDIVMGIFKKLSTDMGHRLLPEDFHDLFEQQITRETKSRVVCDFIAGMTDRYALEFYGRLHSESPKSIFVPL